MDLTGYSYVCFIPLKSTLLFNRGFTAIPSLDGCQYWLSALDISLSVYLPVYLRVCLYVWESIMITVGETKSSYAIIQGRKRKNTT